MKRPQSVVKSFECNDEIITLILGLFKYKVCTIDFNPLRESSHSSKMPLHDLSIVNNAKLVHVRRLSSSLKLKDKHEVSQTIEKYFRIWPKGPLCTETSKINHYFS